MGWRWTNSGHQRRLQKINLNKWGATNYNSPGPMNVILHLHISQVLVKVNFRSLRQGRLEFVSRTHSRQFRFLFLERQDLEGQDTSVLCLHNLIGREEETNRFVATEGLPLQFYANTVSCLLFERPPTSTKTVKHNTQHSLTL